MSLMQKYKITHKASKDEDKQSKLRNLKIHKTLNMKPGVATKTPCTWRHSTKDNR